MPTNVFKVNVYYLYESQSETNFLCYVGQSLKLLPSNQSRVQGPISTTAPVIPPAGLSPNLIVNVRNYFLFFLNVDFVNVCVAGKAGCC